MFTLNLHRWVNGILLALILLPVSALGATRIVMVSEMQSAFSQAGAKGFLAGLGLSFNPAQMQYPLGGGYVFEIETNQERLPAVTQAPDVLAVVCVTSVVCHQALSDAAAKDLLVIALTATSTTLEASGNMLRLAPSNRLQAQALYQQMRQDMGVGSFAVVYEPDAYGLDLYKNFLSVYTREVLFGNARPAWVSSLPFHAYLPLQAGQKDLNAAVILPMLQAARVDAVLYLGFADGLGDLTVPARGGNPSLAPHWYASDGVYPLPDERTFPGLKIVTLFDAGSEQIVDYYYGQDAASFLVAVAGPYFAQGATGRAQFLQIARLTAVNGQTGVKSFQEKGNDALFSVLSYEADGLHISATAVSGH